MKKIVFITILILTTACTKTQTVTTTNAIPNNTILFLKNNLSTSLVIYNNNKTTLIELENKDKIFTTNKLKINNLILQSNIITDINYDKKYILTNKLIVNDIVIEKKDKLQISINNNNLCIYDMNINTTGDYKICDFIYILNNEENIYLNLTEKTKILFYNEYKTFSSKFLEHIYITWIDTYTISNNKITKLELDNNYKITTIN